ncbi:hypothetical protein EBZ39_19110, partial [bacterium]|nr:hypothetical protein [bacterium]
DIWVIKAADKKETEFFAHDEVKPHIESMLKGNKFKDVLEARLKDIRSKLSVVTNEQYFAGAANEKDGDKDEESEQPAPAASTAA